MSPRPCGDSGQMVVPAALSVGRLTLLIFLESDAECLLEKTAIADAPAIAHGRLSANQPPTKTVRPADFVLRLVRARLDSEHGFTGFLKSEEHRYSSSAVRAARCANVESFARVSPLTACGTSLSVVEPLPSWPSSFAPQAITVLLPSRAKLWSSPPEIAACTCVEGRLPRRQGFEGHAKLPVNVVGPDRAKAYGRFPGVAGNAKSSSLGMP